MPTLSTSNHAQFVPKNQWSVFMKWQMSQLVTILYLVCAISFVVSLLQRFLLLVSLCGCGFLAFLKSFHFAPSGKQGGDMQEERSQLLDAMRNYKPQAVSQIFLSVQELHFRNYYCTSGRMFWELQCIVVNSSWITIHWMSFPHFQTIFEISTTSKSQAFDIMRQKRDYHGKIIAKNMKSKEEQSAKLMETNECINAQKSGGNTSEKDLSVSHMIPKPWNSFAILVYPVEHLSFFIRFNRVLICSHAGGISYWEHNWRISQKEEEEWEEIWSWWELHFLSSQGWCHWARVSSIMIFLWKSYAWQIGVSLMSGWIILFLRLGLGTSFDRDAATASLDLAGDEEVNRRSAKSMLKWWTLLHAIVSSILIFY